MTTKNWIDFIEPQQQIDNKNNELLNSSLLALNQLKNQFEVSSDENKPQFQQALDISTLAYNELQNKIDTVLVSVKSFDNLKAASSNSEGLKTSNWKSM